MHPSRNSSLEQLSPCGQELLNIQCSTVLMLKPKMGPLSY